MTTTTHTLTAAGPAAEDRLTLASRADYHVDYSQWQPDAPTSPSSLTFVDTLRKAMVGTGFFYLYNTPLEQQRAPMFDLVKRFFTLPLSTRLCIDMNRSRHFRGYCKFGEETTKDRPDLRDQVDYGPHRVRPITQDAALLERRPFLNLCGPNQYLPDDVCEGHEWIVTTWFDTASEISVQLTRALEQALGVERDDLAQYLTGETSAAATDTRAATSPDDVKVAQLGPLPYARMKTIRYPTGTNVDGIARDTGSIQGVGAHKDSGWLTLLCPSPQPGLQVQDFDGTWIDVPPIPDAIIVNFGQQIESLSSGIVQAATHRVLSPPDSTTPRYSIAFFSSPALNVHLRPLDQHTIHPHTLQLWRTAEAQRQGKEIVSDVPKGDLFAIPDQHFGWINWRGLVRSHPGVVNAFYKHLCA